MFGCDYQEALNMPGILPELAYSLKHNLDILNLLRYPRALPVSRHRLRSLVGDEFFGSLLSAITASALSDSLVDGLRIIFFNSCLFLYLRATRTSRRFCVSTKPFLAIIPLYFLRRDPFCLCLRFGSFLLII